MKTPNISKKKIVPKGIVLHHSAGTYIGTISWCMNPASKVSYHAVVSTSGQVTELADDTNKTWHAGKSKFMGIDNCNDFLLGIAVTGNTNERELTKEEINATAEWCVKKMKKWNFGIEWVTTHRAIAPERKTDVSKKAEMQIKERIKELLSTFFIYEVSAGDTLFSIAKRFGVSVEDLRKLNNQNVDTIKIGQKLKIKV